MQKLTHICAAIQEGARLVDWLVQTESRATDSLTSKPAQCFWMGAKLSKTDGSKNNSIKQAYKSSLQTHCSRLQVMIKR